MGDFLAANNACGQNLLRLVSRGNAIIAELMRLKDYIPPLFRLDSKTSTQKYGQIIMDFVYFKAANVYEQKIENDSTLQELDEELRDSFSDILGRFYLAFESVHKYATELNFYIDEVESGVYIHQSLESLMFNEEGKQLMCEALYLYGTGLLIVDCHFEGCVRERLLVSYYRYNAQRLSSTTVDDVCMLLRSTGFVKSSPKRPPNYPEDYFKRIPIKSSLIDLAIGRLRSDELYNQSHAFPYPEHRSTALSNQAAMLVIILSFSPLVLHNQTAIMREIVDRFFPDNWVISVYMGIVVNLFDWWFPYKAARSALNNTLETANVKSIAQQYGQKLEKLTRETEEFHQIVTLDETAIGSSVKLVRDCNVTLHWILLHTATPTICIEDTKRSRSLKQLIVQESKYTPEACLRLLLNTAQIEHDVKNTHKQLFQDKESKWMKNKGTCVERITELADVFSGSKLLDGAEKNQCLQAWFKEISKHIDTLQQNDGRKIVQLVQALEEVQEFHQLENNLHISQYLADTREILHNMLKTASITEETMITLNIVTDCCYAWNVMESFVTFMQTSIKKNPPIVIKLKALFLKMASALDTPLLRLNQSRSADLSSVSQYYSRELEKYARRVLQIIPETVFGLLAQIVYLETNVFKEIPMKLPKDKLKDYAQLEDRLKMANLTYAVSVFTKGVLSLRSVSLGVLRVDSHRLLEDGIRQELVKQVTLALHNSLVFDAKSKVTLVAKLKNLSLVMDGYRKSFQYIQDYININSLKIWHEEITYIINRAIEEECRGSPWVPGKTWRDFQEEKMTNYLTPVDPNSYTFMGRLLRELMRVTDPKCTVYIEHTLAWYDLKTRSEVLNHKVFTVILETLGTPGLIGLDKLISFFIVIELENVVNYIDKEVVKNKLWANLLEDCETLKRGNKTKSYSTIASSGSKIWPMVLEWAMKIGQLQMFRNKIAYELNTACKFEAKHMEAALRTFNEAILFEIRSKENGYEMDPRKTELLQALSTRLDWAGISDPQNKIYVKPPNVNNFASIIFLFTVHQLGKLHYCNTSASLLSKRNQDPVDAVIMRVGIATILQQFQSSVIKQYITHLCDYVISTVTAENKSSSEFDSEGISAVYFLELFIKKTNISKSIVLKDIPIVILDQYRAKLHKQ